MDEKEIEAFATGIKNVEKRLDRDVAGMCRLLEALAEKISKNHLDLLRTHFHDIYKSLKLHLVFHSGADLSRFDAPTKLQDLGSLIGLSYDELHKQPDENSALEHCADPWSKLLEIFSAILDSEDAPAGSEKHALKVKKIAEEWLKKKEKKQKVKNKETEEEEELARKVKVQKKETEEKILGSNSIFRPLALAKVSHNGQWSVGSSIRVSWPLRPLCLLRRIDNFKPSLKKAIVFYKPLDTADNQNWSSDAYRTGVDEETETLQTKPPCQNCATMFANLEGFIKRNTFLGACAEYCPVDRLLEDKSLSDEETKQINDALEQNKDICKRYFKNFQGIEIKKWDEALEKIRIVFKEHLFGLRPQCNDHFGDRSKCPYTK